MLKETLKGLLNQYAYTTIIKELEGLAREESNRCAEDGRFESEAFYRLVANDLGVVANGFRSKRENKVRDNDEQKEI